MTDNYHRIIVALDYPNQKKAESLLSLLKPELKLVKIGSILFSSEGPTILRWVKDLGLGIFLDLKYHDIPNTVAGAVEGVCKVAPLSLLTIHASGGREMIQAARKSIDQLKPDERPKLLAVTILTSLNERILDEIGFVPESPIELVARLAKLAMESGADGIVCSALEVSHLKKILPSKTVFVVPGIRSHSSTTKDDQQRVATVKAALQAGATHLVVGRPITQAADPKEAFLSLVREAKSS